MAPPDAAGVLARRALPPGLLSPAFSAARLALAAAHLARTPVYADIDASGALCAAGGGSAAALAVSARLAPHVLAAHAVLSAPGALSPGALSPGALSPGALSPGAGDTLALRLRLVREVPPLHELLLWFDERLLAAVEMPFLSLDNIRGRNNYECHECGERFEEPNPLKTHLFLRCEGAAPARLWRRLAARLSGAAAGSGAAAARLEALAAEWGRARGGHACLYCGKLYSRKYGLKIHIRTHTGYRPLRCRHCARAFGDPSNLNKHVRLHAGGSGGGGHACARCGRVLARRRDLARHSRQCAAPAPTFASQPSPL